ncbi:hypothetical protein BC828DRAFT_94411 [Blastocladiella britannica]|nr:hypothetical protein BC828DRAFT_94411 [Blastocladiella britannica]
MWVCCSGSGGRWCVGRCGRVAVMEIEPMWKPGLVGHLIISHFLNISSPVRFRVQKKGKRREREVMMEEGSEGMPTCRRIVCCCTHYHADGSTAGRFLRGRTHVALLKGGVSDVTRKKEEKGKRDRLAADHAYRLIAVTFNNNSGGPFALFKHLNWILNQASIDALCLLRCCYATLVATLKHQISSLPASSVTVAIFFHKISHMRKNTKHKKHAFFARQDHH